MHFSTYHVPAALVAAGAAVVAAAPAADPDVREERTEHVFRYEGRQPRQTSGPPIPGLLPGDEVTFTVEGDREGIGKTLTFTVRWWSERNDGTKCFKKQIKIDTHPAPFNEPTTVKLFHDYAPQIRFGTAPPAGLNGERKFFVIEREGPLSVAELWSNDNLVLEPGTSPTAADQRVIEEKRQQYVSRSKRPPVVEDIVVHPGSVGELRLKIVVVRRHVKAP
jgi:hypothetical protein